MTIYILNLLIILFWYFIFSYKKNDTKINLFFIIVGIQLILLGGLRGVSVGTDTITYSMEYDFFRAYRIVQYSRLEYGYIALMSVLSYLNADFMWLLLATSAIIIFFVFIGIKNISPNAFLSVYLFVSMYLYYYSFNVIRQCMAVAISFFAYKYILNRNIIKYILCILLAVQFHTTALIMLPIYFIFVLTKKNIMFIFLIICYFLFIFINPFIDFVLTLIPKYISYFDGEMMETFVGMRYILVYGLIVLFGAFIIRRYDVDKKFILEFMFICIAFILNTLTLFGFSMFTRLAWYFTIYSIVFIPNCLSRIDNKYIKKLVLILIILITFMYHYYFLSVNYHRIII